MSLEAPAESRNSAVMHGISNYIFCPTWECGCPDQVTGICTRFHYGNWNYSDSCLAHALSALFSCFIDVQVHQDRSVRLPAFPLLKSKLFQRIFPDPSTSSPSHLQVTFVIILSTLHQDRLPNSAAAASRVYLANLPASARRIWPWRAYDAAEIHLFHAISDFFPAERTIRPSGEG